MPTTGALAPCMPPARGALALLLWTWLASGCTTAAIHAPATAPKATPTKTIVLVHGMFMGPSCWSQWVPLLEAKGYRVVAPAWPAHEGSAAQARAAHPDPKLAAIGLPDVLAHYRGILATLDEKPILIGHSMGGLVVQILLSEGLASAAVAIEAAPPKGVFTLAGPLLKSNGRILRGSLDEPLDMDLERFAYVFTNLQSPAVQRAAWEQHARPESRRLGRDSTKAAGRVDFGARRGPLLLVSGEHDHAVPPVIGRKTFRRYRKADALTEYRELEGVDHWLIGSDRWRDVAGLTLEWLERQGT